MNPNYQGTKTKRRLPVTKLDQAALDQRANSMNPNYQGTKRRLPVTKLDQAALDWRANSMKRNYQGTKRKPPQTKLDKSARDQRASEMNPHDPKYRGARRNSGRKSQDAAVNNRANQVNPNNDEYTKSRGNPLLSGKQKQEFAEKKSRSSKNERQFGKRANALAPKDKLNQDAFKKFQKALLQIVPGSSLQKTGSRHKKTSIHGSDWDYHIVTDEMMTTRQRDKLLQLCERFGLDVTCNKAFTLTLPGTSIDFFPQKAQWHENVKVEKPGTVKFTQGARKAIRVLKHRHPERNGHELEGLVLQIQKEKGWTDKNDPEGCKRFSEAQRRLTHGEC